MVTKLQTDEILSTEEVLERLRVQNERDNAAWSEDLALLTDVDLKREARESLVLMMRSARGNLKALGAVRELLDRIEGKPIARTEASLDVRTVSVEIKNYQARNEHIDKILRLSGKYPIA